MKLAVELPVSMLQELTPFTEYDFIIGSHCLLHPEYYNFYRNHRRPNTILDNGAFELGRSLSVEELGSLVHNLQPAVIVLPDVVDDRELTVAATHLFLSKHPVGISGCSYMGVLQGKSVDDYLRCLEYYASISDVSLIGFPYHQFNRVKFIKKYKVDEFCREHKLKIHILGLPNPFEAVELSLIPEIVSIDTSLPVVSALHGLSMNAFQWLSSRLDIEAPADPTTIQRTRWNIGLLRGIAAGKAHDYCILSKEDYRLHSRTGQ